MPLNVRSTFIDISHIAAVKGRSQQALMEYAQLQQSRITRTTKQSYLYLGFVDNICTVYQTTPACKQSFKAHLYPLDTKEALLRLVQVLMFESILIKKVYKVTPTTRLVWSPVVYRPAAGSAELVA